MEKPLNGRAVYAGSFDPITHGHLKLVRRASRLFRTLVIGVGQNAKKKYLFSLEERVSMVCAEIADLPNVEVRPFEGLLINFAQDEGAEVILRGLRAATDFDYEFQMGLINMDMDPRVETLFLLSNPENIFISSSAVKEIAYFGGEIQRYVPPAVAQKLREKMALAKKA
ncbi:MAG: pantetheine-phosphate adenylyltransferase [Myxococcales bacterium]|nr:pantetheine-phosphate adenylyltransferase [Myxococcales bacterium]